MRILIICTGNSCRSQMAEGFFRYFDDSLEVYSAGVKPAKEVNPKSILVMKETGIDISGQKPDNIDKYLDMSFDYVITVCDNAKETCPVFMGEVKNQMHIGFEDPYNAKGTEEEILNKYREVRDLIHKDFLNFYLENIIKTKKRAELVFQHFDGCPNGPEMLSKTVQAIKYLGAYTTLKEIEVNTNDLALKYKFRGSPTLLINGKDFEDLPEPYFPSLSCRFYSGGVPSAAAIEKKIIKELGE